MTNPDQIFGDRPLYWMDETSGLLRESVEKFFYNKTLTERDIDRLTFYCSQWINASCWQAPPMEQVTLDNLRQSIHSVSSREELWTWLGTAVKLGIDPF